MPPAQVPTVGAVSAVIDRIKPSISGMRAAVGSYASEPEYIDACVREAAGRVGAQLSEAMPILAREVRGGRLRVVPGFFNMESGVVDFMDADVPGGSPALPSAASASRGPPATALAPGAGGDPSSDDEFTADVAWSSTTTQRRGRLNSVISLGAGVVAAKDCGVSADAGAAWRGRAGGGGVRV